MALNTSKYGLRDILYITFESLETDQLIARIEDVKDGSFTNGQDTTYATGGVGTPKLIPFDNNVSAMLSGSNALITDGLVKLQTGNDVEVLTSTTLLPVSEVLTVTSNTTTTTYTPTGTADEEIKFAYVVNSDGSWDTTDSDNIYEQASVIEADKFTLSGKTITFNTGDLTDGTKVGVIYYPTVASAKEMTRSTDTFSSSARVTVYCVFVDACTDELLEGRIIFPKAKVSGSFEWSLDNGGDPSTQNFEVEALKSCTDATLWKSYVADSDDFS